MKKSKDTYNKIIDQLELGNSLSSICRSKEMPGLTAVHTWMKQDQKFKESILDARKMGAMTWLDKMQDLLDTDVEPTKVQWNRERLHHARWMASKLVSVYGDKQTVVNEGDPVIQVIWKEEKIVEDKSLNDPSTGDKEKEYANATRTSDNIDKDSKSQH